MARHITKKKIVFITGTRADFGKIKSLVAVLSESALFDVHMFATGMHMRAKYGHTVEEIEKAKIATIFKFINHDDGTSLEKILSNTLEGIGSYIKEYKPDMIVVHGDRVEALAGAIAGSLNNILVAHIEGGEVSGTIDEHVRHAITKMSHLHFVANEVASRRLVQMGEVPESVFVIGSPDLDIMNSKTLPNLKAAKERYQIPFDAYAICIYHPVTTAIEHLYAHTEILLKAMIQSNIGYIVIHPNNDPGTDIIQTLYERTLKSHPQFKLFPSIRFEYFLTLLKHAQFMIGNSSAGIREAPYYGVPAINIGTRQHNRAAGHKDSSVFTCEHNESDIGSLIQRFATTTRFPKTQIFGTGNSHKKFLAVMKDKRIWQRTIQKYFNDLYV